MKTTLFLSSIIFILRFSHSVYSQSITVNITNYPSFCYGKTIEIPVTLTGSWGTNNVFNLKLTRSIYGKPDTTVIVSALNQTSPLRFQLPQIYAFERTGYNALHTLKIEATNPSISSNSVYSYFKYLPQIDLKIPMNSSYYDPYLNSPDEYINPGLTKYLLTYIYPGIDDNSTQFRLNNGLIFSNSAVAWVTPTSTYTYKINEVWNSCGTGRIIGNNSVTVRVNPFKIKNASVVPSIICQDKKIRIKFDYVGKFNAINQFLIDLSNETGDTVRTLTTTIEDSTNVYATLPENLKVGMSRVRVRATSPDAASSYYSIRTTASPKIDLQWFRPYPEPIAFNYPLSLRVNITSDSRPLLVKFSDGTIVKDFRGSSLADITLKAKPDFLYKVDSLVTECGVIKNVSVTGERTWDVKTDFYVEPLPKLEYCEGETLKFKMKSDYIFGQNNAFTFTLFDGFNTQLYSTSAAVTGDSLSVILPSFSIFQSQNSSLYFKISASNPTVISSKTVEYITIRRKPSFRFSDASQTVSTPAYVSIGTLRRGISPMTIKVQQGTSNKTYKFSGTSNDFFEQDTYISTSALKTQNFSVSEATNVCGTTTYSPPLTHTINVTNPYQKYMYFTNIEEFSTMCLGGSYVVKFDTVGQFSNNNVFIVNLKLNGIIYELGRGNQSPLTITIPNNLPTNNGSAFGNIVLESSTFSVPNQYDINRSFNATFFENHKVSFSYVTLNEYSTGYTPLPINKKIEAIKNDNIKLYLNSNFDIPYRYKVNNKWFSSTQDSYYGNHTNALIDINIQRDTIFQLQEIDGACGIVVSRDTFEIKVKKYRAKSVISSNVLCQGDQFEVFFGIEGNEKSSLNNYKIYIENTSKWRLELPIIEKKSTSYIVKIPEFPFSCNCFIKILPNSNDSTNFAKNYLNTEALIRRKANVKITGLDGSDIAWYDGNRTSAFLTATAVGVNYVEWWAIYENVNGYDKNNISYTYPIQSINSSPATYRIKDVESWCGYGTGTGLVTAKKCYPSINPYDYNYISNGDVYSSGFMRFNNPYSIPVSLQFNTIVSAKTFSEFLPGFEVKNSNTRNFLVEKKGCSVINR